jgi:tetratricopeptide (TPR) repeat protein
MARQGKWKEAERSMRAGLSIFESAVGPEHPSVAVALTGLGVLLRTRHRYDEADLLLKRARTIDEHAFPANHPRLAMDLNAEGVLMSMRKRYAQAEDLLLRAAQILGKSLPPGHSEMGEVLLNLADVYRLEKKFDQSEQVYNRGLAVVVSAWGARDPRLLRWLDGYAMVLRARQNYAEAGKLETQATGIRVAHAMSNVRVH